MLFKEDKLKSEFDYGTEMEDRCYSLGELADAIELTVHKLEEMRFDKELVELNHPLGKKAFVSSQLIKDRSSEGKDVIKDIYEQIGNKKKSSLLKDNLTRMYIERPDEADYKNYNLYLKSLYFLFFTKYYIVGNLKFLDLLMPEKGLASFDSLSNRDNIKYISYLCQNLMDEFKDESYYIDYNYTELFMLSSDSLYCLLDIIEVTEGWSATGEKLSFEESLYENRKGSIQYYWNLVANGIEKSLEEIDNRTDFKYKNIIYKSVNRIIGFGYEVGIKDIIGFIKSLPSYDFVNSNVVTQMDNIRSLTDEWIPLTSIGVKNFLYSAELLDICFPSLKGYPAKKKRMEASNIQTVIDNLFKNKKILAQIDDIFYRLSEKHYMEKNFMEEEGILYVDKKLFIVVVTMMLSLNKKVVYESLAFSINERSGVHKKKAHKMTDVLENITLDDTNEYMNTLMPFAYRILYLYIFVVYIEKLAGKDVWNQFLVKIKQIYGKKISHFSELINRLLNSGNCVVVWTDFMLKAIKEIKADFDLDISDYYPDDVIKKIFN